MSSHSQFASRFGAIATTAGSAIGLGNVWRFPYEMGMNGGGMYLLIYILSILLIGVPIMVGEFSIGVTTRKSANRALRQLSPGTHAHYGSLVGMLACMLTLAFYSVVAGWILAYLVQALEGNLVGYPSVADYTEMFGRLTTKPVLCVGFTVAVLLVNHLVIRSGVQKGVERVNRILMPGLFLMLACFAIRSLFLPAAREGLLFMFAPSLSALSPEMVMNAMGQAFFTLSLGCFVEETYASYFQPGTPLVKTALTVAGMDTLVALLAGVFLFPALFTYGGEVAAGPRFIFEVLPSVFTAMPGGVVMAALFFLLLLSAAITSTISMSEVLVAVVEEQKAWSRRKATIVVSTIGLLLAVLCALSFNVLSGFTILGRNLFGVFEYTVSNLLMPLCGLFVCWFVGWHLEADFLAKAIGTPRTQRSAYMVTRVMRFSIRYMAPIAILLISLYNLFA